MMMTAEQFLASEENKTGMARSTQLDWEKMCMFAEAYLAEWLKVTDALIAADGHTYECRFSGCTCGGAERYKAARSEYLRQRNSR
jgi:hypothetical protein